MVRLLICLQAILVESPPLLRVLLPSLRTWRVGRLKSIDAYEVATKAKRRAIRTLKERMVVCREMVVEKVVKDKSVLRRAVDQPADK